jgi:GNAT superfamily N-acetyltransferase
MRVRSAEPQDFDAVTDLLELLGRAEVTDATRDRCREVYAGQISDPGVDHLVAEDDSGAVVGFCSLHFRNRLNHPTAQAWVPDLFVLESARRQGIANGLLAAAEERALARGCWDLTLESGHQRTEAHQLYTSFGMRDAGKYFRKLLG